MRRPLIAGQETIADVFMTGHALWVRADSIGAVEGAHSPMRCGEIWGFPTRGCRVGRGGLLLRKCLFCRGRRPLPGNANLLIGKRLGCQSGDWRSQGKPFFNDIPAPGRSGARNDGKTRVTAMTEKHASLRGGRPGPPRQSLVGRPQVLHTSWVITPLSHRRRFQREPPRCAFHRTGPGPFSIRRIG